eukprot:Gb_08820 [translate_table: standard]
MEVHNVPFPNEAQIEGLQPSPSHLESVEGSGTPIIVCYPPLHGNDNSAQRYEYNDGIQVLNTGARSEYNLRNNIEDDSYRQFVHSVHVDAISSHRHPRILLRSDPHNGHNTSNSFLSNQRQPTSNSAPTIHRSDGQCDRHHVEMNVWNSYPRFDKIALNAHHAFRSRIDRLAIVQMYHICNESYVGIKMDPKEQPYVLAVLTQVEEMLIPRVSPILQVSHAPGGQYKYSGHTISFPQDIHSEDGRNYDCYVKRSRVMNALSYKVRYDRYYAGVIVDEDVVQLLPERATDVSNRLTTVTLEMNDLMHQIDANANIDNNENVHGLHHPTSFASRRLSTVHEMEQIRMWLQNAEGTTRNIMDWPDLCMSPINEYNTEGLFDMAFPTLFPTGEAEWLQPRNMIHQIGCPTIFFTLSAADMQWPNLHQLMPGTPPRDAVAARKWHCNNVIQHPHIVAKYMHLHHTIFREEILTKFHGAIEFWSRYEWQHRGSSHVHGFLWLNGAPDMDKLDWQNAEQVEQVKNFFNKIVHAWNPRDAHHRNIEPQRNVVDDPCLLHTNGIFKTVVGEQIEAEEGREDVGREEQAFVRQTGEFEINVDDEDVQFETTANTRDQNEWEVISGLMNGMSFPFSDLDMLGRHDFDNSHDWHRDYANPDTLRCVTQFIIESWRDNASHIDNFVPVSVSTLDTKQRTAFDMVLNHYKCGESAPPLKLIIQGTAGTRKSYLIKAIRIALETSAFPLQTFPHCNHLSFGGRSVILLGDLAQLPPFMDKPLIPTVRDWELLMTRTDMFMGPDAASPFCHGARIMLTSNLWIDAGLVNSALGYIRQIVYDPTVQPPSPPTYVLIEFDNYTRNAWEPRRPRLIPITTITRGWMRQLPICLAWGLTIHKSQGLTLDHATVDIGNVERQGLTFIAISRVRDLQSLRISPPFSFERYARMRDSPQLNIRKKEEQRLRSLSSMHHM